jgi:hypothetical protein
MFEKMHVFLGGFYVGNAGAAVTDRLKQPAYAVGARDHFFRVSLNPDADAF